MAVKKNYEYEGDGKKLAKKVREATESLPEPEIRRPFDDEVRDPFEGSDVELRDPWEDLVEKIKDLSPVAKPAPEEGEDD